VQPFLISEFDFRTAVSFTGTAVFLLVPSRQGPGKNERRKTKKQEQEVLERNLRFF
jgi:hypothetical protein